MRWARGRFGFGGGCREWAKRETEGRLGARLCPFLHRKGLRRDLFLECDRGLGAAFGRVVEKIVWVQKERQVELPLVAAVEQSAEVVQVVGVVERVGATYCNTKFL